MVAAIAEFEVDVETVIDIGLDGRLDCPERPTADTESSWLPTMTVNGNYNRKGSSPTSGNGLATVLGGSPNPTWIEWFMGFPMGWSAVRPSATQ